MRVSEAMSRDVRVARPDQTIQEAASIMADIDAGVMPVGDHDRLVGMLTDRDIAIRAVARGKGPDAKVRDVMSSEVKYCFEDEDADEVCRNLADQKIRRHPGGEPRQAPRRHPVARRPRAQRAGGFGRRGAVGDIEPRRRAFAERRRPLVGLAASRRRACGACRRPPPAKRGGTLPRGPCLPGEGRALP